MPFSRLCAPLVLLSFAAATAAGHAASSANELRPLAQACADDVSTRAHSLSGTTTIMGYRVTDTDRALWGGIFPGAQSATTIRDLPMVEATALDNGRPGSAWKDCLDRKIQASRPGK